MTQTRRDGYPARATTCDGGREVAPRRGGAFFAALLLGVALVVVGPPPQADAQQASELVGADRIDLRDILAHQQALVRECHTLETQKLAELRQLIQFDQANDQVHLGNPVALKLPAVCLLLNGPPGSERTSGSDGASRSGLVPPAMRLELVNWLYDSDEFLPANNKSKRAAIGGPAGNPPANELFSSQWLDMNLANAPNEIDDLDASQLEQKKLKAQLEQMIQSEAFREALQVDQARIEPHLSPVVLVPGLAGSRLQARVSKTNRVNFICKKQYDWQEIWLTLRAFLPVAIDCWIDNARLEFDPSSGFTREPPGVESRVPDFGSVESIRHLDLKSPKLTRYFDEIITRYEQLGYQPDVNLFAAPYDFRLAPQQIESSFFEPLRGLIERAATGGGSSSSTSGQSMFSGSAATPKRVTLVCHSMGCTHLLLFLRRQSAAWRQTHLRKLIALSSPWGGSIKALKAILVGEQFNIPLVSELKMRDLARTFPGVAYMLPQAEVFGSPSGNQMNYDGQVLAQTPARNYKVNELQALLKDAGLAQHWEWFKRTTEDLKPLEPLADLRVDCIHSLNVPTTETIIFRNQSDFPNGAYELVEGDGDGTVNHQSLLVCAQWAARHPGRIKHKVIMNTSHSGILTHKSTLEHLTEDVALTSGH